MSSGRVKSRTIIKIHADIKRRTYTAEVRYEQVKYCEQQVVTTRNVENNNNDKKTYRNNSSLTVRSAKYYYIHNIIYYITIIILYWIVLRAVGKRRDFKVFFDGKKKINKQIPRDDRFLLADKRRGQANNILPGRFV